MKPSAQPVPSYLAPHGPRAGRSVLISAAAGGSIGLATARRLFEEGARDLVMVFAVPKLLAKPGLDVSDIRTDAGGVGGSVT